MEIYVAGHIQSECRKVAAYLTAAGHEVVSTWLLEDFSKTSSYTVEDRTAIALKDTNEILGAEAVVLVPSPYLVTGGKFVEVGIAIGAGKRVYVLGHRENMLMWHPDVRSFANVQEFIKEIL